VRADSPRPRAASERRAKPAAAPRPEPAPAPERAAARAALVLWASLAALLAARAALAFVPSMWFWGLNVQRFLGTFWAWGPWALAALALVPPLARALTPALGRAGEELVRPRGAALSALLAALLVLAFPDRVRFVGDFLLRQGTVEQAGQPAVLFPQALPLDVFLHYRLPSALVAGGSVDANGAARGLGALEAALLAVLACAFAETLALRGAAAVAAACVVFFGGTLGMFTGFSKAFSEMVLLVVAAGVFGLRAVREGRGLLPLAITLAVGLTLHRSALGLVPGTALALLWGWRGERSRPLRIAAAVVAGGALAVMLPRIVATMMRWDALHLVPPEVRERGGMLRAAFAGPRPADMLGLVTALSPLALAIPPLALALGRLPTRGRELALLATLAAPFVLSVPLLHPAQGFYRDWDDFAAMGESLSLVAAWLTGETLRAAPGRAWVAAPVALGVAAASLQWLAHYADIDRGLARVEAFMIGPPRRADAERGKTWDYVGIRNLRIRRWDAAARAFSHAAETSPSPRILLEWGTAELRLQNWSGAREIFRRVIALSPEEAHAWSGLAVAAMELGDRYEARRAAETLLKLRPGDPFGLHTLERLDAGP
jgi:tetratricopeptide repeat protein